MGNTYETYKDSCVAWIGEIPSEWKVCRLKNTHELHGRIGWNGLRSDEFKENSYAYLVTGQDFKASEIVWNNCYQIDKIRYDEDPFIQLSNGDLLVTKDGTIGKIAKVNNLDKPACLNSGIFVLKNKNVRFDQGYLYWYLFSPILINFNNWVNCGGTTIIHLYQNVFERMPLLIPSIPEQQSISTFLDKKCGEIDSLIALQEEMISELQDYKQSVITEVVTKGLNPNAKMKDSGVEWIGEIPEHWSIQRLKTAYSLHGRIGWNGLRSDEFEESSYAYLVTGQDFKGSEIDWSKCYQIRKERYDEDPFIQLENGDILVTKDGSIGKIAKVTNMDKPACLNSGIFVMRSTKEIHNQNYLYWLLVSPLLKTFNDYINLGGTTIIHLYQNVFERMPLVVPPKEEQIQIAQFLDMKCKEIDSLRLIKQEKIQELKEYKKSIIYEYVTGKKRV